jgi:hypothetical protein
MQADAGLDGLTCAAAWQRGNRFELQCPSLLSCGRHTSEAPPSCVEPGSCCSLGPGMFATHAEKKRQGLSRCCMPRAQHPRRHSACPPRVSSSLLQCSVKAPLGGVRPCGPGTKRCLTCALLPNVRESEMATASSARHVPDVFVFPVAWRL